MVIRVYLFDYVSMTSCLYSTTFRRSSAVVRYLNISIQ